MRGIQTLPHFKAVYAVHKAQHVGNRDAFSAQNLDAFTLS